MTIILRLVKPPERWNGTDLVTDESRKFVLGVATREDLEEFAKRRVF